VAEAPECCDPGVNDAYVFVPGKRWGAGRGWLERSYIAVLLGTR